MIRLIRFILWVILAIISMGAAFWTFVIPLTIVAAIIGYVFYADKKKAEKTNAAKETGKNKNSLTGKAK
ncbi:MAG: hypothetical protein HY226_02955 [Candidatus Vogelbacteria bacterium]|nr:hypothetical protein [Candidatus Vogelbacteria bacterium]